MHCPILPSTIIFALLAGTRIACGVPVDADSGAAIGAIVGVAGAVTAPAAGDSSNCSILESRCKSNHGDYAEYCVEYCSQCDAADEVDCDAGIAGPVDCVEVGGTRCY